MWNPVYKVRRSLPEDKSMFVIEARPHLFLLGAFGVRILIKRYGPRWWVLLNRFESWKYRRA